MGRHISEHGEEQVIPSQDHTFNLFVYGTLCVPAVLLRVLKSKGDGLSFQDALLPAFTRHGVKGESYPAIIESSKATTAIPGFNEADNDKLNTRGTLIRGLSYSDMRALDIFEGTDYSRQKVTVQALSPPTDVQHLPKSLADPTSREPYDNAEAEKLVRTQLKSMPVEAGSGVDESSGQENGITQSKELGGEIGSKECWAYIWSADPSMLEPEIWSFETFMKDKASVWTSLDNTEYDEVDRHHALQTMPAVRSDSPAAVQEEDGDESKVQGIKVDEYPDFGHNMLQYWGFEDGYLNFNHGSYGSIPKPVFEKRAQLLANIESNPDHFMRRKWLPLLNKARKQTAELIGASFEECVIVPNTSHGINTIMNNLEWKDGDRIAIFSTTYGAIAQTAKFICDRHPKASVDIIDVLFPCSHDEIVESTEQYLSKWNTEAIPHYTGHSQPTGRDKQHRVRLVIVDSIASNPGVVYPWERVVQLCKKYGTYSLVDGAHSIGQHKVDMTIAQCDFFVTNCHKWLMAARGAAVMFVPTRNQHLIRSSFPTGAGYESDRYPTQGINRPWSFTGQYEWNGTVDWSPFFSISDAIDFRESIGGEERIMAYCHSLAVEGGKRLRRRWGTMVMDNAAGELTAAMVNVLLPHIPSPRTLEEQFKQLKYLEDGMFENKLFTANYVHGGRWWARFSVQVWNELGDFDKAADILTKLCKEVQEGKHLEHKVQESETMHRTEDMPTGDE